jgi:mono/diheme cytochrome c family protein
VVGIFRSGFAPLTIALAVLVVIPAVAQPVPQATPRSVRVTMQALHESGGVPPGWELSLQPGSVLSGRQVFFQNGCHKCHAVQGANLPPVPAGEVGMGPELTGMGRHHPPAYFVESIVNPSAVLVEGPGYIDASGRSTMPIYPDLSVAQLQDLVAFLSSLTIGEAGQDSLSPAPGVTPPTPLVPPNPVGPLPAAPSGAGAAPSAFLLQGYDIKPDQLASFERWFRDELAPRMRAFPGVVGVETTVDRSRRTQSVTTVFAFRDRAAYEKWNNNLGMRELATKFDEFIGLHGHVVYEAVPVYRAESLSLPAASEPQR